MARCTEYTPSHGFPTHMSVLVLIVEQEEMLHPASLALILQAALLVRAGVEQAVDIDQSQTVESFMKTKEFRVCTRIIVLNYVVTVH